MIIFKQRRMENLLKELSPAGRQFLFFLTPFQTINDYFVQDYWDFLQTEPAFAEAPFQQWEQVKEELMQFGVLQSFSDYSFYLRFSPSFIPFLRRYAFTHSQESLEKLETIFIHYYWQISNIYLDYIQSSQTSKRKTGMDSVKLEFENIHLTINLLLKRQKSVQAPFRLITEYLYWERDLQGRLQQIETIYQALSAYSEDSLTAALQFEITQTQFMLGSAYYDLRQLDVAQQHWEACLNDWAFDEEDLSALKLRAEVQRNLGTIHQERKTYQQAQQYYTLALEAFKRFGDERKQADVYKNLAVMSWEQGLHQEAQNKGMQALELFEKNGYTFEAGEVHSNLGVIAQAMHQLDLAQEHLEAALHVYESFKDLFGIAKISQNLGVFFWRQGALKKAEAAYQKAFQVFTQLKDEANQAQIYQNLGALAEESGDLEQAVAYNQLALPTFIKAGDRYREARTYVNLGSLTEQQGNFDLALQYYEKAIDIFKNLENRQLDMAFIWHNIGVLYCQKKEYVQAEQHLYKAMDTYDLLNDGLRKGRVYINLAILYEEQDQVEKALQNYHLAAKIISKTNNASNLAIVYHNMADLYRKENDLHSAGKYFQEALRFYKQCDNQVAQAQMLNYLGSVAALQGSFENAKNHYRQALQLFLKSGELIQARIALEDIFQTTLHYRDKTFGQEMVKVAAPYFSGKDKVWLQEWWEKFQ